jgi:hypothetical protein
MIIDSHSDLTTLVLSHIPPTRWTQVIYINPWSAFETKYNNRIIQLNFLETKNPHQRDLTARMFMDILEKIYERWWGPRLDMILLNALYLLMESNDAKLPDLYNIVANTKYREPLIARCKNPQVKMFWTTQYPKMPKDASIAVLTKLYRLVQEHVIAPLFMNQKSCIDLREAMDKQKIIIVDLPEGKVTTDIANFVGSLLLSATYLAGMSREDTPEQERVPFFVYIDEAYRYTTKSIPETLQSLRKFRVYLTLASQYLEQYRKNIQEAITQTCETIISFRVGEDTARALCKFYPKKYGYQTLMNLPRYLFFVSTPFCGNREYQVLETIDYSVGPANPEKVIKCSLETYGRHVEVETLYGLLKEPGVQEKFLSWPISPAEWVVLLTIRLAGGLLDEETLRARLLVDPRKTKGYALSEVELVNVLKNLSIDTVRRGAWLALREEQKQAGETLEGGSFKGRGVRRVWSLVLEDLAAKQLLDSTFRGKKAGGVRHIQTIMAQRRIYWLNGWIVRIDTGETPESVADIYVTPLLGGGEGGEIVGDCWDYKHSFAVEVERYPAKHWERLANNYERNRKMGFPTVFIVPNQKEGAKLKEKLVGWHATVVEGVAKFDPEHPERVTIEVVEALEGQKPLTAFDK